MTANPSPAPPETRPLSEPDTHALLRDCRRQIRATLWLLEVEAAERQHRMTGHLVEKGKAILARIDTTLNTEGEARD